MKQIQLNGVVFQTREVGADGGGST